MKRPSLSCFRNLATPLARTRGSPSDPGAHSHRSCCRTLPHQARLPSARHGHKIPEPRAPHHTDTPFTESHRRAQSVFLTLSFPRLSFQLVIKKRSRRKRIVGKIPVSVLLPETVLRINHCTADRKFCRRSNAFPL